MALAAGGRTIVPRLELPALGGTRRQRTAHLDYDLLVTRVENTIMSDTQRQASGITPQQLMARTNPGVFKTDLEQAALARDLTNPREMYSILSSRTKSIEDLAVKFKHELAKSCISTGPLPDLSRTLSMTEIDQSPVSKEFRLARKPTNVHNVHAEDRKCEPTHNKRATCLGESKHTADENKENLHSVNLPHLTKHARFDEPDGKHDPENVLLELPTLQQHVVITNGNGDIEHTLNGGDAYSKRLLQVRQDFSKSDVKLDKWFSEMPNEVFDRAQRALMEETIKEKLHDYQKKRCRKMNFPNQNVNVSVGSTVRKVPNTYLELKVDSFGKHLKTENGNNKLDKYKLQQKSIHNLKMREVNEGEKTPRDDNLPRLALQHRSLTTLALSKKPKNDALKIKRSKTVIKIPTVTESRVSTVYMNDRFDPGEGEHKTRARHGITNYEEYAERLVMTREAHQEVTHTDPSRRDSPPPNTCIDDFSATQSGSGADRDTTKATIVNLLLKKDVPKVRRPVHLEKSLQDVIDTHRTAKADEEEKGVGILDNQDGPDGYLADDDDRPSHDHIITKIPTAQGSLSDSKSSSASQQSNKAALKKFNKLEVFAEHGKYPDIDPRHDPRYRHPDALRGLPLPSSVKLDVRNQQAQSLTNPLRHTFDIPSNEIKKQELVFRFEPGEIYVSRKPQNQSSTYARSSERARVIYGKIVNQTRDFERESREFSKAKRDYKDGHSIVTASTKLDGFQSELSRFESRAIGGSISPRKDDGATNNMLFIDSRNNTVYDSSQRRHSLSTCTDTPQDTRREPDGVRKRDVATETDVIGSGHARSSLGKPGRSRASSALVVQASPDLSDFIVDNNGGESLDSDSDIATTTRLRSNHSI